MRFMIISLFLLSALIPVSMDAQLTWTKSAYSNVPGSIIERADFTRDGFSDLLIYGGRLFLGGFHRF